MVCLNIFVALAIVGVALPSTLATNWVVGDAQGWGLNVDYSTWVSGKTFLVGDSLVFNYVKGNHDVVNVSETDFQQCTEPAGAVPLTSGHDVVPLPVAGNYWYICDFPEHCSSGMALAVNVLSGTPANSPPPPSKSPPPPSKSSPPPPPSKSPPPPSKSPPPPPSKSSPPPPPPKSPSPASPTESPAESPKSSSSPGAQAPPPPPPPSAATGIAFSKCHAWIVGVFSILMIIMV